MLAAVFFFFQIGCAFGTRTVFLGYPPEGQQDASAVARALAGQQPGKDKIIYITQFAEANDVDHLVGHVQNAFGMKTARVVASNDTSTWITKAIAHDLRALGYTVKEVGSKSEVPGADYVITGSVLNVYTSAMMSYSGEVSFLAQIEKDGKKVLEKPYVGQLKSGFNWAARGDSYGQSLSEALVVAVNQFVGDLLALQEKEKAQLLTDQIKGVG